MTALTEPTAVVAATGGPGPVVTVLLYGGAGALAVVLGAAAPLLRAATASAKALMQHAASGAIVAGLAVDIFVRLLERADNMLALALGLTSGVCAMTAVRFFGSGLEDARFGPLMLTAAVDIVVDGVLIGLATTVAAGGGTIFTASLLPELALLGAIGTTRLARRWSETACIAASIAVGLLLMLHCGIGWMIGSYGARGVQTAVLAFGAVVALYLATEELLREAHHRAVTPAHIAAFFGCFLPLFLIGAARY